VKSTDTASQLTGAPVIGVVAKAPGMGPRHLADRGAGANSSAEAYRQMPTNLQFLNVDEPPKTIMVSSAVPDEGKTTTVLNLGRALADAGQRVTIVEADLRRPKLTKYLGLVGGVGLTNVLAGTADLDEVVQRHGSAELFVIGAGPTPPNPGELLSSTQMSALIEKLRSENDFVIVDAPPLLPGADSAGLAVHMNGVLLAVHFGRTRKEQLAAAASALERVGAPVLGVVLNMVPLRSEVASTHGYGYGYGAETAS